MQPEAGAETDEDEYLTEQELENMRSEQQLWWPSESSDEVIKKVCEAALI